MIIDVAVIVLLCYAAFKGFGKGFVVAIFSILAFIIGIAAALRFSAAVASKLSAHITESNKWLPVLSFILVFIAVVILVNLGGKLIQRSFEAVMLGGLNRLAGVLLYVSMYAMIISVFLFYAMQLNFIKPETAAASVTYPYLQPLAPFVIDNMGKLIPFFSDMFAELQEFFKGIDGPAPAVTPSTV